MASPNPKLNYLCAVQIRLINTGKRFNREWIFKNLNYVFEPGKPYAITGPNGSGKSTLLQVIAGATLHSSGNIAYYDAVNPDKTIETPYSRIAFAAPYLDLIEEMTGTEFLTFHSSFKPISRSIPELLLSVGLRGAADKQIRYYSSGMKQRLKLGQAFFSETSVLLLDEPTGNLDAEGIALYQSLIAEQLSTKLIIVSSNDPVEYEFCETVINITDYK